MPRATSLPLPLGSRARGKVRQRAVRVSEDSNLLVVASLTLFSKLDKLCGDGLERLFRDHHRRRLERIGRQASLVPSGGELWAAGDPPPRAGNRLEVLIDGNQALPRMAEAMCSARSHVHIAGWHVTPDFALTRDGKAMVLRALLEDLASRIDVRVLLWAGAPLPLFRPSRSDMRAVRDELAGGTKIRCALDARERPLHCHHEKLILIDDRVAFVGGIDLTRLAGDRFDSSEHPARGQLGWHDAAAWAEGPAVPDIARNFAERWAEVTREDLPTRAVEEEHGSVDIQVLRTLPERVYRFAPRGDFRILEAYLRAFRSARKLVYIENQFLWSPEVVAVLADKLRNPPTDEFRLLVLLPAKPNNGADDTRGQLGVLAEADAENGRFLACTIYSRTGSRTDPLYVHAKVAVVDDEWLTIGSANLNEHSLFNDTEVNLATRSPEVARQTRIRLWAEHLELPLGEVAGDPARIIDDLWRPIADEQLARRRRGESPTHRLVQLPGVSRRSRRLLGPLQGFLVDG